jgi:class 3 adenylate cyclase
MQPETQYAKSGDVHIAYQVVGDGPLDLVYVPGWVSHVEYQWENPRLARAFERLASYSRLILFDKRGTGLSDRVPDSALPTLEERMDDVRAVMDAAGSERAALFGTSEGGPMSLLFASTYPERTRALILQASYPMRRWTPDFPWGVTPEQQAVYAELTERNWGKGGDIGFRTPADASARDMQRFANLCRMAASPGAALTLLKMNFEIDVRSVLPTIQVPTLILHRTDDQRVNVGGSRYMAKRIPGAKYVEFPGDSHAWWFGDTDAILDAIEEFLTGTHHAPEPDRVLATVLFTDIVGSTEHAARLGDRRWRELLDDHDRLVRGQIERSRGRLVKHAGDGVLATFDGPAHAVRCAGAIRTEVREFGLEVRAGLHTGECELIGEDVGGIAVHIGQRVSTLAEPNEVLVSSTVKDLVAGSGLRFEDRGTHVLKGVPDDWRLFRVLP